jgi:hypothetical protein
MQRRTVLLAMPAVGLAACSSAPVQGFADMASAMKAIEALAGGHKKSGAWSMAQMPHFAYGALDKAQFTRAHLMHLANHWTEISPA